MMLRVSSSFSSGMRNWLKENWFKVGILVAILAAAFSVGYYYVIFLPSAQKNSSEVTNFNPDDWEYIPDEQAIEICISDAEKEAQRVNQGLLDYAKTPESTKYDLSGAFDDVKLQLEKDKNECFKKYL